MKRLEERRSYSSYRLVQQLEYLQDITWATEVSTDWCILGRWQLRNTFITLWFFEFIVNLFKMPPESYRVFEFGWTETAHFLRVTLHVALKGPN